MGQDYTRSLHTVAACVHGASIFPSPGRPSCVYKNHSELPSPFFRLPLFQVLSNVPAKASPLFARGISGLDCWIVTRAWFLGVITATSITSHRGQLRHYLQDTQSQERRFKAFVTVMLVERLFLLSVGAEPGMA